MKYKKLACILTALFLSGCFSTSTRDDECHRRAESRLELYNRPVYPLTGTEKQDALAALFDECMRYNGDYQREVDTKNALPPSPPTAAPPAQIVVQNKPPLPLKPAFPAPPVPPPVQPLPTQMTDWQPYASPDKQLEAILSRKY